jgi:hypothetical protein
MLLQERHHEMNWRIESFRELEHLSPADRKRLVRACVSRVDRLWMLAYCVIIGGVLGLLAGGLVAAVLGIARTSMGPALAFAAAPVGVVLVYQCSLIRIRGQLRTYLERVGRMQRLPMCLNCGYDHEGLTSDICPECGMPLNADRK